MAEQPNGRSHENDHGPTALQRPDATSTWQQPPPDEATNESRLVASLRKPRNYDAGEIHAEGGMGTILRARDLNISRTVAMKIIKEDIADPEFILRFVDEARITGQLEHPNIVPVHEMGVNERGRVFYTMKFVKGTTLKQVLDQLRAGSKAAREKHTLAVLLTIFQKVCDAVAFAHSRNIIHRDLKPDNIMIGDYGEVLVMDWGLAKVLGKNDGSRNRASAQTAPPTVPTNAAPSGTIITSSRDDTSDSATQAGTVLGTPRYMAPEQATGDIEHLAERTDIYALGAILYEILTLRRAIAGTTAEEIIANVIAGKIEPIAPAGSAAVPASLAAVAMKALALKPHDRYATVTALQSEITRYQSGFATTAENAGLGKQLALLIGRHKGEAAIIAAVVIALLIAGPVIFFRITSERDRAETALTDLRKTAPIFYEQAKSLVGSQKFADALALADSAISLDASRADYHALRGSILQTLHRFGQAMTSFQKARALNPDTPFVSENIALSERLRLAAKDGAKPGLEELRTFYDALRKQKRHSEALPLAAELRESAAAQLPLVKERLRQWLGKNPPDVSVNSLQNISLSLHNLPLTDLEPLRGLPIGQLNIGSTRVTDLSPLEGMKLTGFEYASGADISDLSVFRGMPLQNFVLYNRSVHDISPIANPSLTSLTIGSCKVTDISCLKNLPLEQLNLHATAIRDYSPLTGMKLTMLSVGPYFAAPGLLRGMPLRRLSLADATAITNVGFLAEFTQLEELVLPPSPGNIAFLRTLPQLRRLSATSKNNGWDSDSTAAAFWTEYDAAKSRPEELSPNARICIALEKQNVRPDLINKCVLGADGRLVLALMPITNIAFLAGMPIRRLDINDTNVSDLTPLGGLPLERLDMWNIPVSDLSPLADCPDLADLRLADTPVTDLRPIAGLKLREIYLARTKVTDLSPLSSMTSLEVIELPAGATGIETLRNLPKLKRISYNWDAHREQLPQTAAEFWAEYDAQKK